MPADDPDYLWDRTGDDPEVARLEALLTPLAHQAPLRQPRKRSRLPWVGGAVVVAAAAAVIAVIVWPRANACSGAIGFSFSARGGDVSCEGTQTTAGVLPIGGVLDTGDHEAELAIANIGKAELGANTRVHLDRTSASGHHLSLDRGHMHAKVKAPPRLFAVATPATDVTDLGCEYTIDIDASGAGAIRVQSGKVELGSGSALVVAPAHTHAKILAGRRPGLPVAEGSALDPDVDAVQRDAPGAIDALLAHATSRDAITLVYLAGVTDAAHRPAIIARLFALYPPAHMSIDDVADPAMFDMWRTVIVSDYETGALP